MKNIIEISRFDNTISPFTKENKNIRLGYHKIKESIYNPIFLILVNNKLTRIGKISNILLNYYIVIDNKQLKKLHNFYRDNNYTNYKDILIKNRLNNIPIYLLTNMFNLTDSDMHFIFKSKSPIDSYKQFIKDIEKEFNFDFTRYRTIFSKTIFEANYRNSKILKSKSSLDLNFAKLFPSSYSDIFKLKEDRKSRLIYVLDVNSMYPYILTKPSYPHPKYLKYKKNINIDNLGKNIKNGIFRVQLTVKKSWLNRYNSIYFRYFNNTYPLEYRSGEIIKTYLIYDEIEFYKKYYDIKIEEGIYSDVTIYSPLKKIIDIIYNKKDEIESTIYKKIYKTILVSLSTSMNQNRLKKYVKWFNSEEEIRTFFKDHYGIKIRDNLYIDINNLKILDIYNKSDKIKVTYLINNFKNNKDIYSIANYMYGLSRVEMLKYIELFNSSDIDLEICYINIDSIHISINKKDRKKFEHFLYKEKLLGKELGKLKIEAIGNRGLWLEIGNYWIMDNNKVIKFSNMLPREKLKRDNQTKVIIQSYDEYGNIIYKKYDIFKSLRYIRKIVYKNKNNIYYKRLNYVNENFNEYVNSNIVKTYNIIKDIFYNFFKEK